ncbi:MAG TPA: hypothetical protein VL359_20690 [bacterium]|nr:hypothetical protein [bacterium]
MDPVQTHVQQHQEAPPRPRQQELSARARQEQLAAARVPADARRSTLVRLVARPQEMQAGQPSTYTLLLSRIENKGESAAPDKGAVAQLARLLRERLAVLPERARRTLGALPEAKAAGIAPDLQHLPEEISARLLDPARAGAALALLKEPQFAAAIKGVEARPALYGPGGKAQAT